MLLRRYWSSSLDRLISLVRSLYVVRSRPRSIFLGLPSSSIRSFFDVDEILSEMVEPGTDEEEGGGERTLRAKRGRSVGRSKSSRASIALTFEVSQLSLFPPSIIPSNPFKLGSWALILPSHVNTSL